MTAPIATFESFKEMLDKMKDHIVLRNKEDFNQLVHIASKHLPFKLSRARELIAMSLGDYKSANGLIGDLTSNKTEFIVTNLTDFIKRLKELSLQKYNTDISDPSDMSLAYVRRDITLEKSITMRLTPYDYPFFCGVDKLIESVLVGDDKFDDEPIDTYTQTVFGQANHIHDFYDIWKITMQFGRQADTDKVFSIPLAKKTIERNIDYILHQADQGNVHEFKRLINLISNEEKLLETVATKILTSNVNWLDYIPHIVTSKDRFNLAYQGLIKNANRKRLNTLKQQLVYFKGNGHNLKLVNANPDFEPDRAKRPSSLNRDFHSDRCAPNILEGLLNFRYRILGKHLHEEYFNTLDYLFDELGFSYNEHVELKLIQSLDIPTLEYIEGRKGRVSVDLSEATEKIVSSAKYDLLDRIARYFPSLDYSCVFVSLPKNTTLSKYLHVNRIKTYDDLVSYAETLLPMMIKGAFAKNMSLKMVALGMFKVIGINKLMEIASTNQKEIIQNSVIKEIEASSRN